VPNREKASSLIGGKFDRRMGVLLVCALIAVITTHLTGSRSGLGYQLGNQFVAIGSAILAGLGAWRHRAALGLIGWLIFVAVAAQWIGTTGLSIDTLFVHSDAFPAWTDAFYLAYYVIILTAILLIVRRRRLVRNSAAMIDAITVTVGVAVLAWCFVIADITSDSTVSTSARLVGALYPICDVLVFGAMTRLLFSASTNRGPVLLLTGGMFCLFAGDVGFTLAVFAGSDAYANWINALYHFAVMMITFSLWQSDTDRLVDVPEQSQVRLGTIRKLTLALGALIAPATLAIQHLQGNEEHVLAAAGGGIVLSALTLIRMSLLVTAVESQSEQLVVLARTDGLTGLANRRTFDFELDRAMKQALDPEHQPAVGVLSVGLLDLDHFKRFNDTHGHSRGDQLLRECAAHWTATLTRLAPQAFMARYGGEEFVVIFRGDGPQVAAEVLREVMQVTPMGQTFSAGVAIWDGAEPALDLLNRADQRMYTAKNAGRKLVVGEDLHPDLHLGVQVRTGLENEP
jgi:diguanylate cyclase (GGDEF)-like protein